jgi:hypothetical protein
MRPLQNLTYMWQIVSVTHSSVPHALFLKALKAMDKNFIEN